MRKRLVYILVQKWKPQKSLLTIGYCYVIFGISIPVTQYKTKTIDPIFSDGHLNLQIKKLLK